MMSYFESDEKTLINFFQLMKMEENNDKGKSLNRTLMQQTLNKQHVQENRIKFSSRLQPPVCATCIDRSNPLWTSQIFFEIVCKLPTCYQYISHLFVTRINGSNQRVILFTFMLQTTRAENYFSYVNKKFYAE